ncbi:hypothetical protein AQUSIP_10300 [Aquicella siphonis]|uniref:N-acetyltransferase domain-containing protein n=1 Tax=Aquicella siphonis TaxID=254247 RepID=A0A5E4PHE0_9COXI|nr:GNAT family N-acetyltransferase [Aquicella siphonis]VVC75736.1 hypothetical protein AQUSIP_10300 [Aquicella siphonis]
MADTLTIRFATSEDSRRLERRMNDDWGGLPLVIRGKKYFPASLDGIIAESREGMAGFLFYEIQDGDCEIIVFEVFDKFKGTGTRMLDWLKDVARNRGCQRIYLMTTNDNLDALRFYQKRGFHICGIHINSVAVSRKIKPSIGMTGDHGIPVRDEIDLELYL